MKHDRYYDARNAVAAYRDAGATLAIAVPPAFPPGSFLHYDRNGHRQTGQVVLWLGLHVPAEIRVRVVNQNRKTVDVRVGDIEELR